MLFGISLIFLWVGDTNSRSYFLELGCGIGHMQIDAHWSSLPGGLLCQGSLVNKALRPGDFPAVMAVLLGCPRRNLEMAGVMVEFMVRDFRKKPQEGKERGLEDGKRTFPLFPGIDP